MIKINKQTLAKKINKINIHLNKNKKTKKINNQIKSLNNRIVLFFSCQAKDPPICHKYNNLHTNRRIKMLYNRKTLLKNRNISNNNILNNQTLRLSSSLINEVKIKCFFLF
jgi:methionyl-tRNA formyltransferase